MSCENDKRPFVGRSDSVIRRIVRLFPIFRMVACIGDATTAVAGAIGQRGGGLAIQGSFFVAELLGCTTDAPFLHVGIGSDFGVHIMPFDQDRQRKGQDEKSDNPYGN